MIFRKYSRARSELYFTATLLLCWGMVLIGSIQQTESKRGLDNYIMTGHLLLLLLSLFNRGSIFVTSSHKRLSLVYKMFCCYSDSNLIKISSLLFSLCADDKNRFKGCTAFYKSIILSGVWEYESTMLWID